MNCDCCKWKCSVHHCVRSLREDRVVCTQSQTTPIRPYCALVTRPKTFSVKNCERQKICAKKKNKRKIELISKDNTRTRQDYNMSLPASFDLTPEDAKLLLAANAHLGSKNVQVCNSKLHFHLLTPFFQIIFVNLLNHLNTTKW